MKRFLLASIMILMTAVCPAGVFAAENVPEEITAEAPAPETAVLEDLPDSEELFEGYFNAQFYGKKTSARPGMLKAAQRPRRSSLQKYEQVLYDALLAEIKAVAAGEKTSTDFTVKINVPEIAGPFSAADLGVDATVSNGAITAAAANAMYDMRDALINVEAVCDALRIDYPYELYWYDKTVGYYYGGSAVSASWYNGSYHMYYPQPMTYSFSFAVSNDYAAANSTETRQVGEDTITASFRTDSSKTAATKTAAANARAVVNDHAGLHDFDKVTAYKEYICEQVEYNKTAAADSYAGGYGDPWQLVWVFDGNASTNVVCEGYAKAFQYLCDLTAFNAKVECRTVTGIMSGGTGAGGHMWNVLQIGGKNYLVDVTNSDAGTVGANGGLFMVGQSGSTHLSYTFKNVKFKYDEDTVGVYTEDERRLSESDFNRNTYVPDLDLYPGKAVTCTEAGVRDYYSYEGSDRWFSAKDEDTLIGNHEDIMIAAAGHTTAEAVRENEVAAACETAGSYESVVYCAVCGQEISRETVSVPASGHEYGAWTVSQEATCDKEGIETRVCAHDPAHVETRKIAKLAHTPGTVTEENRTEATCEADGGYDEVVYCTVCKGELSREHHTITKLSHIPAEAVTENTVEATCTEAGSYDTVVYCSRCNNELSRETVTVAASGHDYGEWTVSREATCSKEGEETRVCVHDPAHVETRETAKLAHTPGDVTEENRTEATCEADGGYDEVVYCMVCKGELSREHHTITKLSHTPAKAVTEKTVEATCTEAGSYDTVVYCSRCNNELSRETVTVAASGHDYGEWTVSREATCSKEGEETRVCVHDPAHVETRETAKLAHTPGDVVKENSTEATCEADGGYDKVTYCSICNKAIDREHVTIAKLAHTPAEAVSENITQPTCTEEGSYDSVVYCSVCHQELNRVPMSLPANGHSPGKTELENEIQATCKEDGSYASVVRCSVCKAVLSKTTKKIPAIGHKFGSWTYKDASAHSRVCVNNRAHVETAVHSWNAGIVTKAPTAAAAGIRTYTCTVCGGTKTESIAKLNAGEPVSPEYAPALEQTEKKVLTMKGDEAPAGSAFGLLKLRAAKTTKKSVKLQWNKVKGASGYVIYGSPCGSKFKKITEIKKGSAKSFTVKKLKKGKYYKFYIVATAEYNGQTKVLAGSKSIHIATAGGKKGNYKTLTLKNVKKNKLTLKVKKKFTVKTKLSAAKGVKVKKHRAVCFESSNPAVAAVTKKGKITAKKAGKCSIFVYAQNGIYKTIKLTVK